MNTVKLCAFMLTFELYGMVAEFRIEHHLDLTLIYLAGFVIGAVTYFATRGDTNV